MAEIVITSPLVDENFTILDEDEAKRVGAILNNGEDHQVHVHVNSMEMAPTAVYFSFTNWTGLEFFAHVGDFPGSHFIYSFLLNSAYTEVDGLIE